MHYTIKWKCYGIETTMHHVLSICIKFFYKLDTSSSTKFQFSESFYSLIRNPLKSSLPEISLTSLNSYPKIPLVNMLSWIYQPSHQFLLTRTAISIWAQNFPGRNSHVKNQSHSVRIVELRICLVELPSTAQWTKFHEIEHMLVKSCTESIRTNVTNQ